MQTTVNNLKDLFMGNPGALQQTMQREQQAKPGVPPDLLKMLALQEITEQHQAAQRDAAMRNNPQNQPTVADSLRQRAQQVLMAKQVQAQQQQMARAGQMGLPQGLPQPQHQPEMGVDQLPANLGQHYDGGGIVAFKEGDLVEPTAEEIEAAKKPYIGVRRPPRIAGEEPKKYKESDLLEMLIPSKYAVDMPVSEPIKDVAPAKSETVPPLPEKKPAGGIAESPRVQPAAPKPQRAPTTPVPTAEPAQPAEPQDPLTAALEKQILGNLSVDKDAKARARRKETEQYLGLDTLAAAQRERAQKEYDLQKQQAQGRNAFSAFTAGINPYARTLAEGLRGGQQSLAAATAGWDKSDFEALQNYNKALSGIDTQTVAGKKFALEAEDTLFKDLSADARNSLTSGTSMINTRENAAARKQAAKDAAAARVAAATEGRLGREAAAQIAKDARTDAAADRQDARYREQAMRLAVAAATKEKGLPTNITKLKDVKVEDLAATMFDRYYQMLKSGKMPESPGAESPGANTKLKFDAQGNLIK